MPDLHTRTLDGAASYERSVSGEDRFDIEADMLDVEDLSGIGEDAPGFVLDPSHVCRDEDCLSCSWAEVCLTPHQILWSPPGPSPF